MGGVFPKGLLVGLVLGDHQDADEGGDILQGRGGQALPEPVPGGGGLRAHAAGLLDRGEGMIHFLKSMSFLVLGLILQQTLIRIISIGSIKPDVVLVILVAVSLRYGSVVGLFSGLTIGLIQDVYAIEALGANAMAKCLVGYFTGLLDEKVIKVMPATKVLFLAVAFLVHDSVYAMAAGFHGAAFWQALVDADHPFGHLYLAGRRPGLLLPGGALAAGALTMHDANPS